ncbi:MFS transporter [Salinicoccus hispanicus]|uniref:MFS transporter n=1 Tax=Salinicoccus hispanicus TaxID=157225 RepID=A0A6N8TXW3_9STAP|nr:MFS transporter [Salinicoccus hispanicus]MXQ50493.1 MFS transporter [Salinicoccus hispanicus]
MNRKLLLTFTIGVFLLGMMELIISGILELMSSDLGISNALTGQLITVYAVSFAIFGPILVKATENFRPKPVILASLVIFILGNLIFGLSSTFLMLAVGRVVTALAAAVFIVKIMDMTVLLSTPAIRGRMIALVYMGFSAANVFGIPIGTLVGQQFGWRVIFWLVILLAVLVGLGIVVLTPNKKGDDLGDPVPDKILNMKNIALYIGITMSVLIGNYIVIGYISPLMTSNGYTIGDVSIALLIAGAGGMLGTILGGNMVDRMGTRKTLGIMLSLFMVTMALMPLLYGIPALFYINLFLWSLFQWSTSPTVQSGLVENVQGSAANVFSWNMSGLNLGIGIGAVIGGIYINWFDISFAPWLSVFIIAMGLLCTVFIKETEQSYQ